MDDRRTEQHEQAVTYWRNVERHGRQNQAEAQQHIQAERQEEDAEAHVRPQRQRIAGFR